ncbi:hypothetical protein B0H15DRAFT_870482 [Mycena belliarum]|uniref:Uncharacterized protein n=1 Tax=Mycena belliarum TaxID=1033014 RepID=A0AAD6TPH0_9AGAR|nr:hypothetical protein B0H15DRAFT_870482 [Mycena belliae]
MQQYPPPLYAPPHPPTAAPHRFHDRPLRSSMRSTRATWGGSMREASSDDDNDTITGQTTTSIASSRSRAPGNGPAQQRRVEHWLHDTGHHAPEFRSPFSSATAPSTSSRPHNPLHVDQDHSHDHTRSHKPHRHGGRREPPPIWVPQPQQGIKPGPQPMRGMPMQPPQPPMVWVPPGPALLTGPAPQMSHVPMNGPPPPPKVNLNVVHAVRLSIRGVIGGLTECIRSPTSTRGPKERSDMEKLGGGTDDLEL